MEAVVIGLDPVEHLMVVGTQTAIIGAPEHLRCKLLSGTSKDAALRWSQQPVCATSLFTIRQNYTETLREYLSRFNEATITVSNPNQEMFVAVVKRASCYIKGEESNVEKHSRDAKEKDSRNNSSKGQSSQPQRNWQSNDTHKQGYRVKPYHPPNAGGGSGYSQYMWYPADKEYTLLNKARVHVLQEILQIGLAPLPPPRTHNTIMGPDTEAWCDFDLRLNLDLLIIISCSFSNEF
ncbi:hypothetical protein TSUD_280010 [Trifolium subterraneum]|uniref:Retrotransposon gag domain-containing protein n=1 Tax=Trifolium subterraneum TaxID=3900 RepID=A0A2Z6M184_TRISU|nr:hypothetical protein TSUD_280010 [Trifolium subterraneum]